jgi:hypothetical protein
VGWFLVFLLFLWAWDRGLLARYAVEVWLLVGLGLVGLILYNVRDYRQVSAGWWSG